MAVQCWRWVERDGRRILAAECPNGCTYLLRGRYALPERWFPDDDKEVMVLVCPVCGYEVEVMTNGKQVWWLKEVCVGGA